MLQVHVLYAVALLNLASKLLLTFHFFFFFSLTFYKCIVQIGFLSLEIRVAFPGESQLRQSRASQPTVHAGRFSVSIIHRTLTWPTGFLTCAHMQMLAIVHGGCTDTVRESALKVDARRKFPCRTGKSSLPQRRAGPTLY